jgi:hypothetical protein
MYSSEGPLVTFPSFIHSLSFNLKQPFTVPRGEDTLGRGGVASTAIPSNDNKNVPIARSVLQPAAALPS